jgi:carbamoyl-phosphate synthase large subunit
MNKSIKIIRSAISSMPSVSIIKLLKANGFVVIGSDIKENSAAREFVDHFFLINKADKEFEGKVIGRYLDKVVQFNINWIISGPENEVTLLAGYENELLRHDCYLFHPPLKTLAVITNKYLLSKRLERIVPQKKTLLLTDYVEANRFQSKKVIIKPCNGRGSKGIILAFNNISKIEELTSQIDKKEHIVQEFIPGKEFSVDVLCDNEGRLLNAVVRERIEVDSGIAIVARTVRNERILEYVIKIVETLLFRGFNCLQFKEDNNEFYLTDINPRIGGASILSLMSSSSMMGNFVNMLRMDFDKLNYSNFDFKEKSMYRYYNEVYV